MRISDWSSDVCSSDLYSQEAADAAADKLAKMVEGLEAEFAEPLLTPDEGVRQAMAIAAEASRPVVLADTQDNPGCGGTGDTTGLLEALVRHDAQGAAMFVMATAAAPDAAHAAGEGEELPLYPARRAGPAGVRPLAGPF